MVHISRPSRSQVRRRTKPTKSRFKQCAVISVTVIAFYFMLNLFLKPEDSFETFIREREDTDDELMAELYVPKLNPKQQTFNIHPQVQHLGVMVDAAHHYFPMRWLKTLIDFMALLNYNWLHLKLTDDALFNVDLVATSSSSSSTNGDNNKAYSMRALKELVKHAKKKGIAIVPEISITSHAGSWDPDLVVPCPEYTCNAQGPLPLNLENPKLLPIIHNILTEVFTVFDYIHLGGADLKATRACWDEAGMAFPDYRHFQTDIGNILADLKVSSDHVVMWEQSDAAQASKYIIQYYKDKIKDEQEEADDDEEEEEEDKKSIDRDADDDDESTEQSKYSTDSIKEDDDNETEEEDGSTSDKDSEDQDGSTISDKDSGDQEDTDSIKSKTEQDDDDEKNKEESDNSDESTKEEESDEDESTNDSEEQESDKDTGGDTEEGELSRDSDESNSYRRALSPGKFFLSNGLSASTMSALDLFTNTHQAVNENPMGITLLTEEAGPHEWKSLNIWYKMVAIAMGASREFSEQDFYGQFQSQCYQALDDHMCSNPAISVSEWQEIQSQKRHEWTSQTCDRLTDPVPAHVLRPSGYGEEEIKGAQDIFKLRFAEGDNRRKRPQHSYEKNKHGKLKAAAETYEGGVPVRPTNPLLNHVAGHTGIMVDTAHYYFSISRLGKLIIMMSKLGFNTLHLRLSDDNAFMAELEWHSNLVMPAKASGGKAYTVAELRGLVRFAHKYGIEIIPEVNFVSRAGGFYETGHLVPCPNFICKQGLGIPLNLAHSPLMAIVSNIIDELKTIFNSPFLHLGYDEREESLGCFEEAQVEPMEYDVVEFSLMATYRVLGIPSRLVVRWESSEGSMDGDQPRKRAGRVTHYQYADPPQDVQDPYFVSTGLDFDSHDLDGYTIYKKMREHSSRDNVLGILGRTLEVSTQQWNGRNIDGKLIAMAIGASDLGELGEEAFKATYAQLCEALDIEGDIVDLLGKSRWSEKQWLKEMEEQSRVRLNSTCSRMTEWVDIRKPKASFA